MRKRLYGTPRKAQFRLKKIKKSGKNLKISFKYNYWKMSNKGNKIGFDDLKSKNSEVPIRRILCITIV